MDVLGQNPVQGVGDGNLLGRERADVGQDGPEGLLDGYERGSQFRGIVAPPTWAVVSIPRARAVASVRSQSAPLA